MDLLNQCPSAKSTRGRTGTCHTSSIWGCPKKQPVKWTLEYSSSYTIDLLLSHWERLATEWFPGNQPT